MDNFFSRQAKIVRKFVWPHIYDENSALFAKKIGAFSILFIIIYEIVTLSIQYFFLGITVYVEILQFHYFIDATGIFMTLWVYSLIILDVLFIFLAYYKNIPVFAWCSFVLLAFSMSYDIHNHLLNLFLFYIPFLIFNFQGVRGIRTLRKIKQ